ncbi:MAG: FKBP-type peptidyl-prolyl cis-trans isomerase [Lutibacter sp.]
MKFKNIFLILAVSILIFSCKKDDDNASFDAAKQAVEDDAALIKYLQTHYLKESDGGIWTIKNGETPLMEQVEVQNIKKNDISYKLYFLTENEGATISPSSVDSIYFKYTGILLDSIVFDSNPNFVWKTLDQFIPGWQYGFTNFKGGNVVLNPDESFDFTDYGKGILFIPSGLAYGNSARSVIPENSPLIFEISLKSVKLMDHDFDGVLSKFEDLNNDNDLTNDDTDNDGIPNFADSDDDGDGKLTKDEDTNGNGNWFDDDTDNDGIPNFLDKDN